MLSKTSLKLASLVLISLQVTSVLAANRAHVAAALDRRQIVTGDLESSTTDLSSSATMMTTTTTALETTLTTGSPQRQCKGEGESCGGHGGHCCSPYQCDDGDRGICVMPTCRKEKEKCGAQHGACCSGLRCDDGNDGHCQLESSTSTPTSTPATDSIKLAF
ncbi:hypothetical protein V5O48_002630 [Marasmius crinis-equi]|uniref:Granulins domain-containing protein n=1 Tax=Marasmius crinis-equi TaxID=585013 RepID=A0ABR3FW55_9AGAR